MAIDIDKIASRCVAEKKTLTPHRLKILNTISECAEPITAYALKDRLNDGGTALNISTIYRVLEFWIRFGIIHKIDSAKTFFVCKNRHHFGLHIIYHCLSCDEVIEKNNFSNDKDFLEDSLFIPTLDQVIELKGECKRCVEAKKSPR